MRVGLLSLTLIIVIFASVPGNLAPTTRIVSAQSSQQRQPQEGLSPEKKRILSNLDPAEVFGPSPERGENNTNRSNTPVVKPAQRNPRLTPPFPSAPPSRPPATSAPELSAAPSETPLQPAETPSPTMSVASSLDSGGIQQPPLGQEAPSATARLTGTFIGLLVLAFFVLAALIFTLNKLWEKIRESSSA